MTLRHGVWALVAGVTALVCSVHASDLLLEGHVYRRYSAVLKNAVWQPEKGKLTGQYDQARWVFFLDSHTATRDGWAYSLSAPMRAVNTEPVLPLQLFGLAPTDVTSAEPDTASDTSGPEIHIAELAALRAFARDDRALPVTFRLYLDAGHGGEDLGAVANGVREKDITLAVVLAVRDYLSGIQGLEIRLSRADDTYPSLPERTRDAAQWGADLFVSVHCNSAPRASASGVEVYVVGDLSSDRWSQRVAQYENAYSERRGESPAALGLILADLSQNEARDKSHMAAMPVWEQLDASWGGEFRGVRQAPFWVLRNAAMPSMLIELGFVSNPAEALRLGNPAVQGTYGETLGRALVEAIYAVIGQTGVFTP